MKILINLVLIGFFLGAVASAKGISHTDIYQEHGDDLSKASFHVRYQFEKQTGAYWQKSSFAQRKTFLEDYYSDIAQEAKESKAKGKREREEIKKNKIVDQSKARDLKRKDKEREKKLKEEEKLMIDEKKAFAKEVKKREKEIKNLRKKQKMRKNGQG